MQCLDGRLGYQTRNRKDLSSSLRVPFCIIEQETLKLYEQPHEKTGFSLCKNKGAYQLYSNSTADQRLSFRCTDSTIPLLKSKISSF